MASRKRKTSKTSKSPAPRPETREPAREPVRGTWIPSQDLEDLDALIDPQRAKGPPEKGVICITKNPIFELAEAKFNSLPLELREQLLRELLALRELSDDARVEGFVRIADKYQLLRGGESQRHVRDDWFKAYFGTAVVDIVVAAGIVATQRSLVRNLPIDLYWAAGPDQNLRFAVTESNFQITVTLITPSLVSGEKTRVRQLDRPERIWFAELDKKGKAIVYQQYATGLKS